MECLLGVVGDGFVALACDTLAARSVLVLKHDAERMQMLNEHAAIVYSGEPGDCSTFVDSIRENVQLYGIRNDRDLGVKACATFSRRKLADALRSRTGAIYSNILVAGYDKVEKKPRLFWIDYLAAMVEESYACHGTGAHFCYATMDRHYSPNMSRTECVDLLRKCIAELKTRVVINLPRWRIHIIDANGSTSFDADDYHPTEQPTNEHQQQQPTPLAQ